MKKLMFFCLMSVTFLLTFTFNLFAQNHKVVIRGTVTAGSGYPVPGARVIIDGKATTTTTDEKGHYRIKVNSSSTTIGIVTFGGGILIDSLKNREIIDFFISPVYASRPPDDIYALRPPINLGYSSLRSGNVTNATRFLDPRKTKRHYSSISEMIDELVGLPGGPLNFQGASGPLILVNGLPDQNLSDIQPDLVESITYLKDGAAAIYGSRAFGGVILIKTSVNLMDR